MQQDPSPLAKPRKLSRGCLIALIVVGGLLVIGIANAIANGGNTTTSTSPTTPTSTAQNQPATTPTPKPTSKPLTIAQQAVQLAQNASPVPFGKNITAKTDDSGGLTVTEFLDTSGFFNNGAVIVGIKSDCFTIEKALWQAKLSGINDITIDIEATLQDQYGNNSTGSIANCDLSQDTESKFNWSNLDYNQAWLDYDTQYYLPSLNN